MNKCAQSRGAIIVEQYPSMNGNTRDAELMIYRYFEPLATQLRQLVENVVVYVDRDKSYRRSPAPHGTCTSFSPNSLYTVQDADAHMRLSGEEELRLVYRLWRGMNRWPTGPAYWWRRVVHDPQHGVITSRDHVPCVSLNLRLNSGPRLAPSFGPCERVGAIIAARHSPPYHYAPMPQRG